MWTSHWVMCEWGGRREKSKKNKNSSLSTLSYFWFFWFVFVNLLCWICKDLVNFWQIPVFHSWKLVFIHCTIARETISSQQPNYSRWIRSNVRLRRWLHVRRGRRLRLGKFLHTFFTGEFFSFGCISVDIVQSFLVFIYWSFSRNILRIVTRNLMSI